MSTAFLKATYAFNSEKNKTQWPQSTGHLVEVLIISHQHHIIALCTSAPDLSVHGVWYAIGCFSRYFLVLWSRKKIRGRKIKFVSIVPRIFSFP